MKLRSLFLLGGFAREWALATIVAGSLLLLLLLRRSSALPEAQRRQLLEALAELARRFFPVCQDLSGIAKTVRSKVAASQVAIPEETLQQQLLRQCQAQGLEVWGRCLERFRSF